MSEVRIVDLEKLGVDIDTFDKIYSMGEEDGRTDAIAEISREMRMLYGNEYEKQIRADKLSEICKQISERVEYWDGCAKAVEKGTNEYKIFISLAKNFDELLEQLKEQK